MQPSVDPSGAPAIGSEAFWSQPFRYAITGDGDTDTARTVGLMCEHIRQSAESPLVKRMARQSLDQFSGLASVAGAGSIGSAAFWWCKHFLRFKHHEFIIRERIGEAGHLQGLISPEVICTQVSNGERPEGDCAIYTDLIAAFLTAFGVNFEIVTVAVNSREPDVFSHVYLYEVLPGGERLPLDAGNSLDVYPGWQIPSSDIYRRQVWDRDGNPVADRGSRYAGLGNYVVARGFGADGDFGGEYTGTPAPGVMYTQDPYLEPGGTSIDLGPGYFGSGGNLTVPSQSSPDWAAFAAKALQSGFTLAAINTMQPGTVINPNGQIVRQSPGFSVTPGTFLPQLSAAVGGGNNLLYVGLGLAAVFVLFSMGKGR